MMVLFYLFAAPLGWLIVQDLRYRYVSIWVLLLFGVLLLATSWLEHGFEAICLRMLFNVCLLLLLYIGIRLYVRLRYGAKEKPFHKHIGWGDAWFLVALTPAFDLRSYVWFLILSLSVTVLVFMAYQWTAKRTHTIPLVSALGIAFALYIFIWTK